MLNSPPLPHAADFMRTEIQTVTPEMSLNDVVEFLLRHKVSNAPVVNEKDGQQILVGFISEQDCLAALSAEGFFGMPAPPQTAKTIMRMHPICVDPQTELFTLASIFVNHDYRHLPVTSGQILEGIVSRRDILQAMHDYYRVQADDDRKRRSPPDLTQIVNHRFLVSD